MRFIILVVGLSICRAIDPDFVDHVSILAVIEIVVAYVYAIYFDLKEFSKK